jgi:hypothetical protein
MNVEFTTPFDRKPGIIASLLRQAYAHLVKSDPSLWEAEQTNWKQYDREVFARPTSVGACIFFTLLDGRIVGFGSWDQQQRPYFGIIGHQSAPALSAISAAESGIIRRLSERQHSIYKETGNETQ